MQFAGEHQKFLNSSFQLRQCLLIFRGTNEIFSLNICYTWSLPDYVEVDMMAVKVLLMTISTKSPSLSAVEEMKWVLTETVLNI